MSDGEDDEAAEPAEQEPEADDGAEEGSAPDAPEAAGDDADAGADDAEAEAAPAPTDPDEFESRLDAIEERLEAAETEAALDDIEADLDAVEDALEAASLPEPDEDDEDAEDPGAVIEERLGELRDRLEDERGPYAEDAVAAIEEATETIEGTRWTADGRAEVRDAVAGAVSAVADALGTDLPEPATDAETAAAEALGPASEAIEGAGLDPDEDAETVAALIEATDTLTADLEAAEEWDDLTTTEQLEAEGFFDVLDHRKDFPPEWHALKIWEERGNAEMVLLALEKLQSEFMEEHCLDALERMGPQEALEPMLQRAGRRDKAAIRILGTIGDPAALDTILEFVDADSDPALQKVTLRAIGQIGSEEATQAVANKLDAENEAIRSRAARALGLIGDPRAIEPLEEVLATNSSDQVRASAAWALTCIGTRSALEIAAEYTDDRSYLVQAEAERAAEALEAATPA